MYDEEVPVLIVGGALTGLSAAVFLAWHGVRPVVVERHPDTLIHPRARGVNARTAELFRQVGMAEVIETENSMAVDFGRLSMVRAQTLAGPELFSEPLDSPDPSGDISPCEWAPIDQDRLELLLRARAGELGAEVRFSTELVSLTQDDGGVTAVLEDRAGGGRRTVRAGYVIAADGGRSPVREALGVAAQGPGIFATQLSLLFAADLGEATRGREIGVAYLDKPSSPTILFSHDGDRRWIFATELPAGATLEDMTEQRCVGLVREAIGLPDLDVEILPQLPAGGAKALTFVIGAQVAERYRDGRVFFAGDAAHLMPPTGGFGASTGIQDVHNLAWKLAAVLAGTAGEALLDTYHAERHPVAWLTVQTTLSLMQARTGADGEDGGGGVDFGAVVFGYRYGQGPPVRPDLLGGEPGTRAPHLPVERDGRAVSLLDVYGRSLVLLTPAGADWAEPARAAARRLGVPLEVHTVGGPGADLVDPTGRFTAAYGVGRAGAVLVRPDGFVAWRAALPSAQPESDVAAALAGALATDVATRAG